MATEPKQLECDLVMKGGITSGIVYPGAIASIAEDYRIRAIGGTSAGAIAAAAAAAMEFGRRSGRNPGAARALAAVPRELGSPTPDGTPLLTRLFHPDPATAPLLLPILDLLRPGWGTKIRAALSLVGLPLLLAIAAAAGLLWAAGLHCPHSVVGWVAALLAGAVVALALLLPLLWLLKVRKPLAALANEGFGFCSGMSSARIRRKRLPSLTGWLHDKIQQLAGLPSAEPLTFGDLWTAELRAGDRDAALAARAQSSGLPLAAGPRAIDLALVASDISRSISVQFPFLTGGSRLYCRISDLEALFPADVVAWMRTKAPPGDLEDALVDGRPAAGLLIRLPEPQDLPVLVAARVSMSFPILFRAVRFYLLRYRSQREGGGKTLEELWLADGGVTSNFPVHLFDSPVPTRPTFCLNLLYPGDELHTDAVDEEGASESVGAGAPAPKDPEAPNVRMARTNSAELVLLHLFPKGSAIGRLMGWGGRIIYTARQWNDITLMNVPAYRDRIVHIRMLKGEGGLNLAMTKATIERLDARGTLAGRVIARRFLPNTSTDPLYGGTLQLNWNNHRFVRFRSWLAAIEVSASRFAGGWAAEGKTDPSLETMIDRTKAGAPLPYVGYPFTAPEQRRLARSMVAVLQDLNGLTDGGRISIDFVRGRHTSPRPKPALRMRPPLDCDPRSDR